MSFFTNHLFFRVRLHTKWSCLILLRFSFGFLTDGHHKMIERANLSPVSLSDSERRWRTNKKILYSWTSLWAGARPPPPTIAKPGEWQHGWQYYASSSFEHHFRETAVFAPFSAADQAHLLSHAGPGASAILCGAPTSPEFTLAPSVFRTTILERLWLPLVQRNECDCPGQR